MNSTADGIRRAIQDAYPIPADVERLIAAAPDLLAALRAVRGDVEAWAMHLNDTGKLKASQDAMVRWDRVNAAIARAEGQ